MKTIFVHLLFAVMVVMAGCGGGGGGAATENESGSMAFQIDLSGLGKNAKAVALAAYSESDTSAIIDTGSTITAVTATLSRDGYGDIGKELSVSNNVASATITGLAKGYWHVAVNVYNGQAVIYTGSVDVNVIAGAQVAAEVLFDPVNQDPPVTTGSVNLRVGLNKFPGYTKISQFVSTIVQDEINSKFYIFDSSARVVAVYNANTLVREKDIALQASPQALAVETGGGSLLLGYSTGKIYRLKISDETLTLLADSLLSITSLMPISSKYVLVSNGSTWGSSNVYETINLENGQVVTNNSYWYPLNHFSFNEATGMAYALDSGLSPGDIHRIAINPSTGTIDSISDSRYHGSYSFGTPIRVVNSGARIATGSGNMFISSSAPADDVTFAGNLGHTFTDLVSDDTLGNLYMLNSDNIRKLLIIEQDTFFTITSVDLVAEPKQIFHTPNSIIVFVKSDTEYYAKIFSKSALGLM